MISPRYSSRKFGFHTYYYDPNKDDDEKRIKFKRILKSPKPAKKPLRKYLLLTIIIAFFVWYLNDLGTRAPLEIRLENISVEDVSPDPTK